MGDANWEIAMIGLEDPKAYLAEQPCKTRLPLLKLLDEGPAKHLTRMFVLKDLGLCALLSDDFVQAIHRFESAIQEVDAPEAMLNVDYFNQHFLSMKQDPRTSSMMAVNLRYAPLISYKEAAEHLKKGELGLAAMALRRGKLISLHEQRTMYNSLAKGNNVNADEIPKMIDELRKRSKLSHTDKTLLTHASRFGGHNVAVEYLLQTLDDTMIGEDKLMSEKRESLRSSKLGLYFPGLSMQAISGIDKLGFGEEFLKGVALVSKELQEGKVGDHQMLLKHARGGFSCKRVPRSCEFMETLSDLWTNGFGKTIILDLQAEKTYDYSPCETNGNLAVLVPFVSSVVLATRGIAREVEKDSAVVIDFCLPWKFTSKAGTMLLVAQAWHPHVSSLERLVAISERAHIWGLEQSEVTMVADGTRAAARMGEKESAFLWATGRKLQQKSEL